MSFYKDIPYLLYCKDMVKPNYIKVKKTSVQRCFTK